jgi:hypothetical protein
VVTKDKTEELLILQLLFATKKEAAPSTWFKDEK